MSDESKLEKGIPIKDAVTLMNRLNEGITYGTSGFNAREFEKFREEKLEEIDWKKVRGITINATNHGMKSLPRSDGVPLYRAAIRLTLKDTR